MAAYDSELGYVDRELRRLHDSLGWDQATIVLVVSTHGEGLWDRGKVGHGLSLYDEEIRGLFVLFGPDFKIPEREVSVQTSLVDVMPTLLDILGLPFQSRDGLSLLQLLGSRPPVGVFQRFRGRTLYAHHRPQRTLGVAMPHQMVVQGPWKLISDDAGERLYQRIDDPAEKNDRLADGNPPEGESLRRALGVFEERMGTARPTSGAPIPSAAEKIESLLNRTPEGGD